MRTILVLTVSSLALAGCGKASYAVAKLDCPAKEGDLRRVSVSADGKSCAYRASDGAEVSLELTPVVGSPEATLSRIKADLRGAAEAGAPATPTVTAAKVTSAEVARVHAEAAADAKVAVAEEDEERSRIDLPGVHISETAEGGEVSVGPLKVTSDDRGTTVDIFRNTRMRGEALSREKRGVRATFIYTKEDLPSGYRYVGFEAGGPKAGPLTVAKVRSKTGAKSSDSVYEDVQDLVRRNGGV